TLEDDTEVFLFGERGRFPPPGVAGGEPGAVNRFVSIKQNGERAPPMASKAVGITLAKGERVRIESPGGGGYGAPHERAPTAIARDLALGYETNEHVRKCYGGATASLSPGEVK